MGVLIQGPDYYGTLAALRSWRRAGIEVVVATDDRGSLAAVSRGATRIVACPDEDDPDRLVDALVRLGRESGERLVLYPANDHLAWIYAAHADRLSQSFDCYQPPEPCVFGLLDKHRLAQAAAAVGLEVPRTLEWDGTAPAPPWDFPFPALLKPRTQVGLSSGLKGIPVASAPGLAAGLREFAARAAWSPEVERLHPDVRTPLLQQYLPQAETAILSVSGFRSREGGFVARFATKVLQRPRKLGIGLCFEGAPEEPALARGVEALCDRLGYFGVFEAEFITVGPRRLLIDFNPRFYSQLGFDLARGLDLPMLVYRAARGEQRELARLLDAARAWRGAGDEAYCHRGVLEVVLRLQGASRRMAPKDVARWRAWLAAHRAHLVDAVWAAGDPVPGVVDTLQWLHHAARHPRSFIRQYVLNR